MTDRSFEDALNEAVALAGGWVTPESSPAVIPPEQLRSMMATIAMLGPAYDIILNRYNFKGGIALALTNSPEFTCQAKRLGGDKYAILVPLGMPARVRVLAHILLRYWGRETGVQFVRSLRDNLPVTDDSVPKLLHPLFLNQPNFEGYWDSLHDLDQIVSADPNLDPRSDGDVY